MSHSSPATYLVWSTLSCLLGAFLIYHLWSFDRFKCLKWSNGQNFGAFKRVMTYSYLLSVPLILAYSVGFTVLKYKQGYSFIPDHGIVPTPYQLWPQSYQTAIFPLYLMFSVAWSLEMVTHLEELCFWLFLINAGSVQRDWFTSLYFKAWAMGSCVAVVYMPLVTVLLRGDLVKCEAYTFLAGSIGSLSLTLWFTPVLWTFPNLLQNLKAEGVDLQVLIRLTKFHELNSLRVFFRYLFVLPLIVLGVDGVRPHQDVNASVYVQYILAMIAAVGCCISSGITLIIFFPRSIESEIGIKEQKRLHSQTSHSRSHANLSAHSPSQAHDRAATLRQTAAEPDTREQKTLPRSGSYLLTSGSSPVRESVALPIVDYDDYGYHYPTQAPYSPYTSQQSKVRITSPTPIDNPPSQPAEVPHPRALPSRPLPRLPPNRRRSDSPTLGEVPDPYIGKAGEDVELGPIRLGMLTEENLSTHDKRMKSRYSMLVHTYTSPIDLAYGHGEDG
ncbi:hypothetical protein JAAARDRAFT_158328 [Jaapia argillacea MUCL 33604]|uniref:Uncharacterized protein n=1 Tax=Jaapia argillacea MUCL 33604 TaxID=933084 RepID=A0A067Q136_9AGAM|nr:hypothetical protein JAAARDRAFT_158328 [Jaapia argillacea MUCL 33604]